MIVSSLWEQVYTYTCTYGSSKEKNREKKKNSPIIIWPKLFRPKYFLRWLNLPNCPIAQFNIVISVKTFAKIILVLVFALDGPYVVEIQTVQRGFKSKLNSEQQAGIIHIKSQDMQGVNLTHIRIRLYSRLYCSKIEQERVRAPPLIPSSQKFNSFHLSFLQPCSRG